MRSLELRIRWLERKRDRLEPRDFQRLVFALVNAQEVEIPNATPVQLARAWRLAATFLAAAQSMDAAEPKRPPQIDAGYAHSGQDTPT